MLLKKEIQRMEKETANFGWMCLLLAGYVIYIGTLSIEGFNYLYLNLSILN